MYKWIMSMTHELAHPERDLALPFDVPRHFGVCWEPPLQPEARAGGGAG